MMNRSRITRLEKMAKPDAGKGYLIVMKDYSHEKFYFQDDLSRTYPSEEDAVKAWESEHGELPRSWSVVDIVDFKSAPKLQSV